MMRRKEKEEEAEEAGRKQKNKNPTRQCGETEKDVSAQAERLRNT